MMSNNTERANGLDLLRATDDVMSQIRPMAAEMVSKDDYRSYLINLKERLDEPIPILSLDGMTLCSEGNISAIVGAAKSRKTFLCSALVAGFLQTQQQSVLGSQPHPEQLVLWVDTEQSKAHVQQLNMRILRMAGVDSQENHPYLKVLALREIDPKQRAKLLFEAIDGWKPRLVVIDGISDLLYNTNDLEESERIVTQLMRTSSRLKNHILMVLHTNPNSDKARGHIGSALLRKSESVLYVHKVGDCSVVEPQYCRNEPFERFAFQIDGEGIPCYLPIPEYADQQRNDRVATLQRLLQESGGVATREVLTEKLRKEIPCSMKAAQMRITRALRDGVLVAHNQGRELTLA